jgi:Ca2+-binding RTX toxin-like protein
MATKFFAKAGADTFANPSHSVNYFYGGFGTVAFDPDGFVLLNSAGGPNSIEPYNQFDEGEANGDRALYGDIILTFISSHGRGAYYFEVFDDNSVDYSFSTAPVSIDLTQPTQHGGFAEGDSLGDIFEVTGSAFDDVIRGSNVSDFPPDTSRTIDGLPHFFATINKPGQNVLNGGAGNDLLEGRGGADTLNGGSGFDTASYESSPSGVTVRLAGVGSDTQTALASGGDAAGDTLSSIEGLIGSAFDDRLTGNSLDNTLDGRGGNDTLDGRGGSDTLDGGFGNDTLIGGGGVDTASFVSHDTTLVPSGEISTITLGLNGADGAATRSQLFNGVRIIVETDVLRDITNVTGSSRAETITGNELANTIDGRGGNDMIDGGLNNDVIDGGLGNDTLIGGGGTDTVTFVSHDSGLLVAGADTIRLGLSGADGSYIRLGVISTIPFQIGTVETDVLRDFDNVTGSNRSENITGNELVNVIDGRDGSDRIDGGFGNDTLIGGAGIDTVSYASHDAANASGVTIVLNSGSTDGSATATVAGRAERDVLRGFENVSGSNHADTITGNDGDNTLEGRGGDDTLNGLGGNDTYDFRGTTNLGLDVINDTSGTDRILINSLSDIVDARHGTDDDFDDLIITLQNGTTILINHHFTGTNNVETAVFNDGSSVVLATLPIGGNLPGIIGGTDGDDTLDGRGGDDLLFGAKGNDVLLGSEGNDRLDGGPGRDTLVGGPGDDVLTGGRGADTFVFTPITADNPSPGNDVVTDFQHGRDVVDLTAFVTSFWALDDNHNGRLDNGEGDGEISVAIDHGDTVLNFDGGSVRIQDAMHMHANDFLF